MLYEDESFKSRELAALVASKVLMLFEMLILMFLGVLSPGPNTRSDAVCSWSWQIV